MLTPCLHLDHPNNDDTERVNGGEGGQEEVEAGGEEDGDAKKPIGGDVRGEETSRHLGQDVTPKEGGVHVAYRLGSPLEFRRLVLSWCCVDFHHCHTNIAANAKGYEEANGQKHSLTKSSFIYLPLTREWSLFKDHHLDVAFCHAC